MKIKHLKSGWDDTEFENKLQKIIDEEKEYTYYDIKISSKNNDCLIIFKK